MRKKGLSLIAGGAFLFVPSCSGFCDSFYNLRNPPEEVREIVQIESLLFNASSSDFEKRDFREDFARLERRYGCLSGSERVRELRRKYENTGEDCLFYGSCAFLGLCISGTGARIFKKNYST